MPLSFFSGPSPAVQIAIRVPFLIINLSILVFFSLQAYTVQSPVFSVYHYTFILLFSKSSPALLFFVHLQPFFFAFIF